MYEIISPLSKRRVPLVHWGDHHIDETLGSGLVHIAPAHGFEDFDFLSNLNKQPGSMDPRFESMESPVDEIGHFINNNLIGQASNSVPVPEFLRGKFALSEHTQHDIFRSLALEGLLLHSERYYHKYPHDWRTKQPVLIRTTRQWFANLEPLKPLARDKIPSSSSSSSSIDVSFLRMIPESGRARLLATVESRDFWCISRQRF